MIKNCDTARPMDNASSTPPSPPSGPMTRSRAKALHDKVNSFLYMCDIDPTEDSTLHGNANALCILRYEPLHGSPDDGHEDGQEDDQDDEGEAALSRPVLPHADHWYYRSDRYYRYPRPGTTAHDRRVRGGTKPRPVLPLRHRHRYRYHQLYRSCVDRYYRRSNGPARLAGLRPMYSFPDFVICKFALPLWISSYIKGTPYYL